jgi:hypothetical protein
LAWRLLRCGSTIRGAEPEWERYEIYCRKLLLNVLSPPQLAAPPLHDLLGASFVFNSPATALAWDRDFACFGLANGAVAILRAHWQGAPELAPRPGGGLHIVPCSAPPPPPAIFALHKAEVLALSGDPLGGILSGGADGVVQRLLDGEILTADTKARRRIVAVAAGRGGRRAFAAGRQVDLTGPDGRRLIMKAPVTALAYDPSGLHLAVGHERGVSLEAASFRESPVHEMGAVTLLAWRQDGAAVAAAGPSGIAFRARPDHGWTEVAGLAGAPTSIAFVPNGTLIIGGQDFVQHWRQGGSAERFAAPLRGPIACHPRLDLFAAADDEGRILLRRIGVADAMVLREPGPAPSFIAFSPDGQALAFAAEDGEAGTVMLPDLLFRTNQGAAP